MKRTTVLFGVLGLAAAANAQFETELGTGALDEGVQVEIGGLGGAPFFANAQGNDDDFQEFYVMRFDLSAFGGGPVLGVELDLRHEETFFAAGGLIEVSYSTDDAFDLSTLTADPSDVGGNTQLPATQAALFDFVDLPGDDDTTIDTITLNDVDGLFADIQGGGVITLVLEAAEPGTAATYAGIDNFDGAPVLRIIPAPGSLALLGLGGLVASRRRRA